MDTLAARLKHYRKQAGLSQRALGRLIGMSGTNIADLEKGAIRSPRLESVSALEQALSKLLGTQVTIAVRHTGDNYETRQPSTDALPRTLRQAAEPLYTLLRQAGEVVMVRPAGAVSAGGGAPEQALIPYLPRAEERGHDFVWLEVIGECMEPRIQAGHVVIVDISASPRSGHIVVAEHDGGYLVKLLESVDGHLELAAVQGQAPVRVTDQTRILGVVVAVQYRP